MGGMMGNMMQQHMRMMAMMHTGMGNTMPMSGTMSLNNMMPMSGTMPMDNMMGGMMGNMDSMMEMDETEKAALLKQMRQMGRMMQQMGKMMEMMGQGTMLDATMPMSATMPMTSTMP